VSGSYGSGGANADYYTVAAAAAAAAAAQRQKRMRTSFKHHQLRVMKSYFELNHNPDAKDLKQLSQKTGLSKRVLQVWFQNARAKYRRGQGGGGSMDGSDSQPGHHHPHMHHQPQPPLPHNHASPSPPGNHPSNSATSMSNNNSSAINSSIPSSSASSSSESTGGNLASMGHITGGVVTGGLEMNDDNSLDNDPGKMQQPGGVDFNSSFASMYGGGGLQPTSQQSHFSPHMHHQYQQSTPSVNTHLVGNMHHHHGHQPHHHIHSQLHHHHQHPQSHMMGQSSDFASAAGLIVDSLLI
jgi:hypothetical protein